MTNIDSYKDCVVNVSNYMDLMKSIGVKYTAFDGSSALAVCFNLPKEKTINDLIKYRMKSK